MAPLLPLTKDKDTQVEKAMLAETIEGPQSVQVKQSIRGLNVYTLSDLMGVSGRDKHGHQLQGQVEVPMFTLSVKDRIEIFAKTTTLQGVVTGRSKRISGLDWRVTHKGREEDRIVEELKEYKEIFDEFQGSTELKHLVAMSKMRTLIQEELTDVLPDLSNFNNALRRYKHRNARNHEDQSTEIEEWLKTPNIHDSFEQFIEKSVTDLMIHGTLGVFKEWLNERIDNIYPLPGGTIFPFRSAQVGGPHAFFQMVPGIDAKIYFQDEVSFLSYVPASWSSYGIVPLEALINKVAESLLFDKRAADQADGTRPPEKIVVFGKNATPFGSVTSEGFDMPMDENEQKRIETKLAELRKEAIVTLSGVGTPLVLDISKSDTFSAQQTRQDKILRDMALIYNMSNMEVNLSGGEFTSGKETSETQRDIEQEKGIKPILLSLQNMFNREILPYRFGFDYEFKFEVESSEDEQIERDAKKFQSGSYDVNQIREDRGDDIYPEDEFNRPQGGQTQAPDGSELNPLNMRGL